MTALTTQSPKKILVALPGAMLGKIDFVAVAEHRTRSDLIREALRRYLHEYERRGSTLPSNVTNINEGQTV